MYYKRYIRRFYVKSVVEKTRCYIFWVCVCDLIYPTYKAYVPPYIVFNDLSVSAMCFHIIS